MTRRRRRAVLILSGAAAALACAASGLPSRWEAGRAWDRGVRAALVGDADGARRAFGACLQARPDRQDCQAGLNLAEKAAQQESLALEGVRDETPAAASPDAAAPGAPVHESERDREATALFRAGRLQEAADVAREALLEDPRDLIAESVVELARKSSPAVSVPAPAADDDAKKRAVQHWVQGIQYFQKNETAKARDEWLLCRKFDAGNDECREGLARLDTAYGSGR